MLSILLFWQRTIYIFFFGCFVCDSIWHDTEINQNWVLSKRFSDGSLVTQHNIVGSLELWSWLDSFLPREMTALARGWMRRQAKRNNYGRKSCRWRLSTWNENVKNTEAKGTCHLCYVHIQKNVVVLMMICHDNVACCFSYIWKMTLCSDCVYGVWFLFSWGREAIWEEEEKKKKKQRRLDINFSRVSSFIVNAPSDMSEKLKCRQSVVLTIWHVKWCTRQWWSEGEACLLFAIVSCVCDCDRVKCGDPWRQSSWCDQYSRTKLFLSHPKTSPSRCNINYSSPTSPNSIIKLSFNSLIILHINIYCC